MSFIFNTIHKEVLERQPLEPMHIKCPSCLMFDGRVTNSKELGRNGYSDEIHIHLIACQCGTEFVGIYEESRRGSLDSEKVNYWGYCFDDGSLKTISKRFQTITLKDWDLIQKSNNASFRVEMKR